MTHTPDYRSQVLMRLISMGCGEQLTNHEELMICAYEDADQAPAYCVKDILEIRECTKGLADPAMGGSAWFTLIGAEQV